MQNDKILVRRLFVLGNQARAPSQIEYVKQKAREEQIHDKDGHGGLNECGNRSAAYALCPAFHPEPLITTDCRDDESENNRLGEAYTEVPENQRMDGTCPELLRTKM